MDLLVNLGLQILDFVLTIPLILFTILFDVVKPLLWVIIPLMIINWLLKRFTDNSLLTYVKRIKS